MTKEVNNDPKHIVNDNYFVSNTIILDENIDRVWSFFIDAIYYKQILPKNYINFKINQKKSSLTEGDDFSFYWIGVSNIHQKVIAVIDKPNIKKLILDVSINIGIYYRKTYNLYSVTSNNSTLLKIILTKIPNKVCDFYNFVSFIELNPDLYKTTLINLKEMIKKSSQFLSQTESAIINKNNIDSWNIITDLQKLSTITPIIGTNFTFQDSRYKKGSFVKCFNIHYNKNIFMIIKEVDKRKKKNRWVYALETFGADINHTKQEIQICVNKIDENRTQICVVNIFNHILSKEYLVNLKQKKKEAMKEIKKFLNNN